MTTIKNILQERGLRYGSFSKTAETAEYIQAAIYKAIGDRTDDFPSFLLHAFEMIAVKLARIANGDPTYADNWNDIIGYCTLVLLELEQMDE